LWTWPVHRPQLWFPLAGASGRIQAMSKEKDVIDAIPNIGGPAFGPDPSRPPQHIARPSAPRGRIRAPCMYSLKLYLKPE